MQEGCSAPNVMNEIVSGSQVVKLTCVTCGKKDFGKFLAGTAGCIGWGKDCNKVRDCPTLESRGREFIQVPHNAPDGFAPKRNHFYSLQAKGEKLGYDVGKLQFLFFDSMASF